MTTSYIWRERESKDYKIQLNNLHLRRKALDGQIFTILNYMLQ